VIEVMVEVAMAFGLKPNELCKIDMWPWSHCNLFSTQMNKRVQVSRLNPSAYVWMSL
jgi:hypothetical protein